MIKDKTYLNFTVFGVFIVLLTLFKWNFHEMWKDEWQAWFVATDQTLPDMFGFLNYEGHPALWYLYLKFWSVFSSFLGAANTLKLSHLVVVVLTFAIVYFRFSLPLWMKIGFVLSYYFAFEYGIISRGYILLICLLFLLISLIKENKSDTWLAFITIFLLCQTEIYGVFMTFALILYLGLKNGFYGTWYKNLIAGVIGFFIFLLTVYPRESGHITKTQGHSFNLFEQILASVQGNLANTFFIGSTQDTFTYGYSIIGLLISVLVIVGMYLLFSKNKPLLYTFFSYILVVILFSSFVFFGGIRQWGLGFVFFIAMLELADFQFNINKVHLIFVGIIIGFSFIYSVKAFYTDFNIPFTNAKDAGYFLKSKVPDKVPIMTLNKFSTTPVIGYADRKFFYLPDGLTYSYFKWVEKVYLPTESELRLFAKYKGVGGLVIISDQKVDENRFPSLKLWEAFDKENYKRENYYIYTLTAQ